MSTEKNWLRNALQKWLIPVVAFGLIIVHMIWPGLMIDAITLGLLVIVILPWLPAIIENAKLPGGWELTFRKIEAVQQQQEKQQSDLETQRSQIKAISILLDRLVTGYELDHLKRLQGPEPFEVNRDKTPRAFLDELRHLLVLRFLERKKDKTVGGLWDQLKVRGRIDVKDYVLITDGGKEYLSLRRDLETEEREGEQAFTPEISTRIEG